MKNDTYEHPEENASEVAQNNTSEPSNGSQTAVDLESSPQHVDHPMTLADGIVVPPENRTKKPLIIIGSLIAVVLLGVGGYFLYQSLTPKPAVTVATVTPTPTATPKKSPTPDVAGVVTSIRNKLSGTTAATDAVPSVAYKSPAGYWTRIGDTDAAKIEFSVVSYPSRQADVADLALAKKELAAKGVKLVTDTGEVKEEEAIYMGHYASDTVACSLTNLGMGDFDTKSQKTTYSSHSMTLSCAKVSDFAQRVAALEPFSKALAAAQDKAASDVIYAAPEITKSPIAGYARASIAVTGATAFAGGYQALLYQTPDTVWHFFMGTQNDLMCTEFNTADIKKAFAGYPCYVGETMTKVTAS